MSFDHLKYASAPDTSMIILRINVGSILLIVRT